MKHSQNFDELIVGFIGETLIKGVKEKFDELLVIRQSFLLSNYCTLRVPFCASRETQKTE